MSYNSLQEDKPSTLNRLDFKVLHILTHGTPVKTLCKYLLSNLRENTPGLTISAASKRVYRQLNRLKAAGLVKAMNPHEKPILWLCTEKTLDLFGPARNSNQQKKSPFDVAQRTSEERKRSIKLLQSINQMSKDTTDKVIDNFGTYLDDCDDKVIILKNKFSSSGPESPHPDYLFLPYQTRFSNPEHHSKNLHIYNEIWNAATVKYKRAVHLVLTTDPKRFKNLWEANRHFSKAFNRFMSYLTKHFKHRPKYFAAYEYTKSGLMHAHIIIFGIPYLLPHQVITHEWERCDQGSYNYIYSLINNNGDWVYARKQPKELKKGETARDYLQKYLKKGSEQPEKTFMYWVFNKRFFTYARALYKDSWPTKASLGIYKFLMSCFDWDIPDLTLEKKPVFAGKPPPWDLSFPNHSGLLNKH